MYLLIWVILAALIRIGFPIEAGIMAKGRVNYALRVFNHAMFYVLFTLFTLFSVGISILVTDLEDFEMVRYSSKKVPSSAMEPSVHLDDRFVFDRFYYSDHTVQTDDVGIARRADNPEISFIKRVLVCGPGRLDYHDGQFTFNGQNLSDAHVVWFPPGEGQKISEKDAWQAKNFEVPIDLADDELFLVGDNRMNSLDSRDFGPVKRSEILGKVLFIYWPEPRDLGAPVG